METMVIISGITTEIQEVMLDMKKKGKISFKNKKEVL